VGERASLTKLSEIEIVHENTFRKKTMLYERVNRGMNRMIEMRIASECVST
jgi:hypothetical protein